MSYITKSKYFVYFFIFFLFVLNESLAIMSWAQISSSFYWITSVKQSNDMKVRHFLQMSPQVFALATLFYYFLKYELGHSLFYALLLGISLGCFSELTQLFVPTRIFSVYDIFWNIYASLYGVSLFLILHTNKYKSRLLKTLNRYNLFLFFITTSFIFFQSILFVPFSGDDYKILLALKNPHLKDIEYWKFIFSNPTNGGVQYRPLSYYASGIILNSIAELTPTSKGLVAIFLVGMSASLLYLLILKVYKKHVFAPVIATFLIIGPWLTKTIVSFRDLFKYSLTLFFLLWGVNMIYKKEITLKSSIALSTLTLFSILCHEGAIVFPIVFLLFCQKVNLQKKISHFLILATPSLWYIYARTFIWGIPQKGFMMLNFYTIDDVIFHHISTITTLFYLKDYWLGLILIILLTLYSFHRYYFDQNKNPFIFTLSALIVLIPFALLDQHVSKSHSIWPAIFVLLVFSDATSFFFLKLRRKELFRFTMNFLILMVSISVFASGVFEKNRYIKNGKHMESVYNELHDTFAKRSFRKELPTRVALSPKYNITDYEFEVIAASLAHQYSNYTFLVEHDRSSKKIFIKNGYLYIYTQDNDSSLNRIGSDIFKFKHNFQLPDTFYQEFETAPLSGNFKENYHNEGFDQLLFTESSIQPLK